ncbi:hypothetical protein [Candidatus Poriferisocius sp.]|uniref:hypothetical protein n=1 Tax=Candidatus Poriferisocius sp. TaxID=3101276 RepID=UPI003B5CE7CF
MGSTPGVVKGEWDDQPHNWRTFFRRWRRGKEPFRFEVVRTEAMSAEAFFVIGRSVSGRVQPGDPVVVQTGDSMIATRVASIDHTVQDEGEFHMLMALQLDDVGPDTAISPGDIIHHP